MWSPISVTRSLRLLNNASFFARCSPDDTSTSVWHVRAWMTTRGPAQPETANLAAEEESLAAEPVAVGLEHVHEPPERAEVVERQPFDAERQAREPPDPRLAAIAE